MNRAVGLRCGRFLTVGQMRMCAASIDARTAQVYASLKKKARVRFAIENHPKSVISTEEFTALATTGNAASVPDELMSTEEAKAFLDALNDSGCVIVSGHSVFLRPEEVISAVYAKVGVAPLNTIHPEEQARTEELLTRLREHDKGLTRAALSTALYRRRFWSGVAVASGLQMAIMAHLTFNVYGWDTMEPASYFLTTSTALACYLYFVIYKREHSYATVDDNLMPAKLESNAKIASVDLKKWIADLEAKLDHDTVVANTSGRPQP